MAPNTILTICFNRTEQHRVWKQINDVTVIPRIGQRLAVSGQGSNNFAGIVTGVEYQVGQPEKFLFFFKREAINVIVTVDPI